MAAIAKTAGSPLLILDGLDILDPTNLQSTMAFLLENVSSDFEHILLTSTFKGKDSDLKPFKTPGLTKWVLQNGTIRDIR